MLLEFLPQAADATDYLAIGKLCAETGNCYNELRPVGVVLWFSIPYRLGFPPSTLIFAHWILLLVSWLLSVKACRQLLPGNLQSSPVSDRVVSPLLAGFLLLVHVIFLWPVMFNSLSDAPAATLMLVGLWLLVLSRRNCRVPLLFFAAICFGIVTSFRIYYLYIVLMLLVFYFLLWSADDRQGKWSEVVLLLALLPAVGQYWATWKHTNHISYISHQSASTWQTSLLNSPAIGYDTVVPLYPLGVYTDCSRAAGGLRIAMEKRDYAGLACIFYHRVKFYFSSYMPYTYIAAPENYKDNLLRNGERPWSKLMWNHMNIRVTPDAVMSPDGIHKAASIHPITAGVDITALVTWFWILKPESYTASMWLWAPQPLVIHVGIVEWGNVIPTPTSFSECKLSAVPQRCVLSVNLTKTDVTYALMIGKISKDMPASFGVTGEESFYAWGVQVIKGAAAGEYLPDPRLEEHRLWSSALFIANIFMLVSSVLFLFRKNCLLDRTRLPLLLCPMAIFILGIITVPEQRFIIVTMIVGWCVAITCWLSFLLRWLGNIRVNPVYTESG